MDTHRRFRSTLLLALLLVLTTVSTPWLHGGEAPVEDSPSAMMMGDSPHHCHDTPADENAHCDDERGCVFCGVAPLAATARVDNLVLLLSQVLPLSDQRAHHFEQPVELRPPQSALPV